jgi:hypothetical protein
VAAAVKGGTVPTTIAQVQETIDVTAAATTIAGALRSMVVTVTKRKAFLEEAVSHLMLAVRSLVQYQH